MTGRDALDLLSAIYPQIHMEPFGARFVDEIQSIIWYRYPWRHSLAELPPFYLIARVGDYYEPLVNIPDDFWGIHEAYLCHESGVLYPLEIAANLTKYNAYGRPRAISYLPERSGFRIWPLPDSYYPPDWWVAGTYKKRLVKITNENLASQELPFDDMFAHVIRQGLLWKFKQEVLQSAEAMNEMVIFLEMIRDMARAEGIAGGAVLRHPEEGLAYGG